MSRFEPIVRLRSAISRSLPQFAPARRPHTRRRFTLERLEERAMLSTIPVATNLTVSSLDDSGVGTLRAAINQADTGTGNQYTIKFAVKGTIDLTSALPDLDNNIVIKGPGAAKLDIQGDNEFTILNVYPGKTVSISGVTISGGNGIGGVTGGIDNAGTLTVDDCVFANNNGLIGGAISSDGTLTVKDSVFSGNTSPGGGAIVNGGDAIVVDSVFIDNSATESGGAINNYGTLTIANSDFISNVGVETGGAIYSDGTLTVNNSLFVDNTSWYGGGIYNGGLSMTLTGNVFVDNAAEYDGGGIAGGGVVIINNNVFVGNSVTNGNGGAIYWAGYEQTLTVDNSVFVDNSATNGGGIFNVPGFGTLTTTNDFFFDNTGGDIYP